MTYVDTCYVMMFINKKDVLRAEYGIERKPIDKLITDSVFRVPLSAIGETFHKIGDKVKDREHRMDIYRELQRLFDIGFLEVAHIDSGAEVFSRAATIMCKNNGDDRDSISPMDALILAVSVSDRESKFFCTTNQKLMFNYELKEYIKDERNAMGFDEIVIKDLLLKGKPGKNKSWN